MCIFCLSDGVSEQTAQTTEFYLTAAGKTPIIIIILRLVIILPHFKIIKLFMFLICSPLYFHINQRWQISRLSMSKWNKVSDEFLRSDRRGRCSRISGLKVRSVVWRLYNGLVLSETMLLHICLTSIHPSSLQFILWGRWGRGEAVANHSWHLGEKRCAAWRGRQHITGQPFTPTVNLKSPITLSLHVFGLREEAGDSVENPQTQGKHGFFVQHAPSEFF